ncbi:MAG: hypothetical protein KIT84_42725 [Labilithrix sp.]|nr:hypothetical protein [Labilithrix sp.]MCW5817793.1 hypothetical protein [Labilithrix sp.]
MPLVVVNDTSHTISSITVSSDGGQIDIVSHGARVPPGERVSASLKPNTYAVTISAVRAGILHTERIPLRGATELVVQERAAAAAPAAAGFTQLVRVSDVVAREAKEADRASKRAEAEADCAKSIPQSVAPSPGKTKITGKWTCNYGGAREGTDWVNLVQLADGKITATIAVGVDRGATWEGAVVHDELRFRFSRVTSGGVLKIDPGGRALTGEGQSFADGQCHRWTLTCTR